MFELLLQTFWAEKTLVKSLHISTLHRQGNLLHWMEHFYRAQQKLSSLRKIGWRPAGKKLARFFQHACSI
jgi:hypothetical protein